MATINSAFSVMSKALDADQAALNVVSNNVANANTPGYTAEKAVWQEDAPLTIRGIHYGDGSSVVTIKSTADTVLQERLDQQQQLASASDARLTALNSVQSVFSVNTGSGTTSSGDIGTNLTSFFDSFSSLESDPTNQSKREEVLSTASTLAANISSASQNLSAQQGSLNQSVATTVSQINALTKSIASLNKQIEAQGNTENNLSLEDQRRQDISNLSKLVGINQVATGQDRLEITTTNGQLLVSGDSYNALTTGANDGVTDVFLTTTSSGSTSSADITSKLYEGGGQLGGALQARDQDISTVLGHLDQLAYGISTQVNALNNAGTDLDEDTSDAGNVFYQQDEVAGSAGTMAVIMTDPNHIAAASSSAGTGDNSNSVAMADLATAPIVNGATPSDYYSTMLTDLGALVSEVQTQSTAQNASVSQLQSQVSSESSVNLNDEASTLATLERSYQAASQVFSLMNTLMASALNLGTPTTVS
ncbi:flagellar hook-associated protein FlgK [Telmatobacter bradus]|uniref:flagellar hook-associated protein FlgK n=1 Tax=Telmatobacter bradus TaxID=474953 RepID=UPI003B42882C